MTHSEVNSSPLLSIITVVFNGEAFLGETIKSVKSQKKDWIEYIIVDGGSTDMTIQIINDTIDVVDTLLSEPDSGIYDAMNKGISLAKGHFISFLNAGDTLLPNFCFAVKPYLNFSYELISFGVMIHVHSALTRNYLPVLVEADKFNPQHMYLPHPGLIASIDLFKRVGGFNTKYRISGDLDWINRVLMEARVPVKISNEVIVEFIAGGVSENPRSFTEARNIAILYGKNPIKANYIYLKQILLWLLNKVLKTNFNRYR